MLTPWRTRASSEPPSQYRRDAAMYMNNSKTADNKGLGGDAFASVTINLISHTKADDLMEGSNGDQETEGAEHVNGEEEEGEEDAIEEEEEDLDDGSFTSESSSAISEVVPLPNIFIPCTKCHALINICRLQCHRNFHSALRTLQFSSDQRPTSLKALVKRRRLLITRMQESSTISGEDAFGDKQLHKLNTAFEIMKNEIEGSTDQLRVYDNCVGKGFC